MERLGDSISYNALGHRITRGTCTFAFILRVMQVLNVERLDLPCLAVPSAGSRTSQTAKTLRPRHRGPQLPPDIG
jgi:hypothetical protein